MKKTHPKFDPNHQHGGVEADLAETIDTTQTQAIKDLAVQLHNNPTEIYTWVANNIRFVPSYGSIQGADMTLQAKRGNATHEEHEDSNYHQTSTPPA